MSQRMFSMSSEKAMHVPAVLPLGRVDGPELDQRLVRQRVHDDVRVAAAARHVPGVHAVQFGQADGRLHLGHAVVPADHVVDVGQLLLQLEQVEPLLHVVAVVAEAARQPGQVLVVGGDHAAFAAGGEGLVLAEAAAGDVAQRAGLLALVDAAEGLGVVLDDEQLVLLGEGVDRVHVAHVAVEVHRHDGLGALVDQLLGRLDAEAVVVEVHVGEARDGAGLHDGEAGGDEGVAGHDHLVARPDAQRGQRRRAARRCRWRR